MSLTFKQIDEDGILPTPPSLPQIVTDAALAIVAGSDTTSSLLSNVVYCLLKSPQDYGRLRDEVDATFPADEGPPFDAAKLAAMPFLNAVM